MNKLYSVKYFNEFTIPVEHENIRQQPRGKAAILSRYQKKTLQLTSID